MELLTLKTFAVDNRHGCVVFVTAPNREQARREAAAAKRSGEYSKIMTVDDVGWADADVAEIDPFTQRALGVIRY